MPGISRYLMARKSLPDPPMMAARARAAHEETSKRSQKPEARSQKPEARSQKPEARSQKREARSQKPEARSQKPEARSQKPEARSQKRFIMCRSQNRHILASGFLASGFLPLKHVLQRKLQDSWIPRSQYLSKEGAVDCRRRICRTEHGIHVIWKVERLGSELQRLILPNLETSSHSHVDLN